MRRRARNFLFLFVVVLALSVSFFACTQNPSDLKTPVPEIKHRPMPDDPETVYGLMHDNLYTFDQIVNNLKSRGYEIYLESYQYESDYVPIRSFHTSTVINGVLHILDGVEFPTNDGASMTYYGLKESIKDRERDKYAICCYGKVTHYGSLIICNDIIAD